ncbi:flagellar export protein FliJ [Brevibacillus humidisoli]|uniref:flagellar export protein FliJ n=1 Tax=Brevibacillus humidisoli TaxID=2895522 RepID=UPI001E4F53B0|nr:flagellar export protein FliJ [Brevibacillus humidisoli]UFJ42128.1 flagellar export protein FliJ [Brevibacillus humidisoli]
MKTFTFHLQKILDLKEKEREQAEWAFGKSLQKKAEEEAKLINLTRHREEVSHTLYEMQNQPCSVSQLIEGNRYQQAVERAIQTQRQTLYGCELEVEDRKQKLTSRMQESKLWEKMREQAKERFDHAQRQMEQKELDEIGISRYTMQQTSRTSKAAEKVSAPPLS